VKLPPPTLFAHRGLHHDFPENSAEAFAAAFAAGIAAVECDVRMTADRVPILMHDDTLDRTTTATGHVAAAKWTDLRGARLRRGEQGTDCRIPTLHDLFSLAADAVDPASRIFLVEQKARDAELTRLILDCRSGVKGRVILQSFDAQVLDDAFAIDPQADLALLCGKQELLPAAVASRWPHLNLHHSLLTRQLVTELRETRRTVGTWTPNTEVELRGVMAVGVDVIITDQPIRARSLQ